MALRRFIRTPQAGRSWLGALGVLAVAATFGWFAGPVGLAAALVVAAGWWTLSPASTVAVGHVAALPVLPGPIDATVVLALEAGFLGILAGPIVRGPDRLVTLSVLELAGIGLGVVAWASWSVLYPRWLAAALVVVAVAFGMYVLHRYSVAWLEQQGVAPES